MVIFSGSEDYCAATLIVSIFGVNTLAYGNGYGLTFRLGKVEFQNIKRYDGEIEWKR